MNALHETRSAIRRAQMRYTMHGTEALEESVYNASTAIIYSRHTLVGCLATG